MLGALTVVMSIFALTAASPVMAVVSLVLMGGFGFATVPGLQTRIMTYAGSAATLASGANIAAFNFGNAAGAWLGSLDSRVFEGFATSWRRKPLKDPGEARDPALSARVDG